jgi:hypothetical protein
MEDYTALAGQIETRGDYLAARTAEGVCTGAFWEERFGDRGQRHAAHDAAYHVQYLVSALRLQTPSVITRYARWLQGILTPRGMCTRHIEEHFEALSGAVRDERIPGAETASAYLEKAVSALRYDDEVARAVQDASEDLEEAAWRVVANRHPDWTESLSERRVRADLRYLLSYLADAVALRREEIFGAYISWVGPFQERHGAPPGYIADLLAAVDEGELPDEAREVILDGRAIA